MVCVLGNQLEVPTGTMIKHAIEHKYVQCVCAVLFCSVLSTTSLAICINYPQIFKRTNLSCRFADVYFYH